MGPFKGSRGSRNWMQIFAESYAPDMKLHDATTGLYNDSIDGRRCSACGTRVKNIDIEDGKCWKCGISFNV